MNFGSYSHISLQNRKNFYICAQISKGQKMNKFIKTILTLLGITLVGGVVVKERDTLNDLRKRLFDMRHFEVKKPEEREK